MAIVPLYKLAEFKQAERAARKKTKLILSTANKPIFDDANNHFAPLEIRKIHFDYEKPDFHREAIPQTEDEIISSVLNRSKHNGHKRSNFERLCSDVVSEEVKDFWRQKLGQSLVKRGQAYKKL